MAQHDYVIANQSGAAFRADLNNALAAIVSQNSGAAEPSVTYAYQPWADTTTGLFKIRNAANSDWITLYQLDGEWSTIALEDGSATAPSLYFKDSGTDTGVYSPGVDQVAIATGGVQRVNFNGATEVVFNDGGADVDFRVEGDTKANLFKVDAGTDAVSIDGAFSVAGDTTVSSLNGGPLAGTRNRIINGDMRIDQRNAGASVTINTAAYTYTLDRWAGFGQATDGVFTVQRSTVAPAGFVNSLLATVSTADTSIGASQFYVLRQSIEGLNVADLAWGTSAAQSVTLSFWVRSSLTGTFSGSLTNSAFTRSYPFTYTINAANTYEYKTITVAGDTTGTWLTDSGIGVSVFFDVGSGSSNKGTAGAWSGSAFVGATGSVNLIGTNGATFYITGVQLEAGTVATPFERRSYGQELALCQRYYCKTFNNSTAPAQNAGSTGALGFISQAAQPWDAMWRYPVEMRAAPSVLTTYSTNAASANWSTNTDTPTASTLNVGSAGAEIRASTPAAAGRAYFIHATAEAEL